MKLCGKIDPVVVIAVVFSLVGLGAVYMVVDFVLTLRKNGDSVAVGVTKSGLAILTIGLVLLLIGVPLHLRILEIVGSVFSLLGVVQFFTRGFQRRFPQDEFDAD